MRLLKLLAALSLVGCAEAPGARQPAAAADGAAADGAAADTVWLDVRTPQEYAEGHVAGAILIPYDQMAVRWQELEAYRDRPMVVYCRSGRRSGIALDVLRRHGFDRAENGGAFSRLARSGVPTATGPAR
jgi:phage shock protein E